MEKEGREVTGRGWQERSAQSTTGEVTGGLTDRH